MMRWQHDWQTLRHDTPDGLPVSQQEASDELLRIFGTLTLDKVIRAGGGRRTLGSVVQLQAHDDGYIARPEGERLLSSLRSALADDAQQQPELRWLEGGHAAAFLQQQAVLVPAIADAIDSL